MSKENEKSAAQIVEKKPVEMQVSPRQRSRSPPKIKKRGPPNIASVTLRDDEKQKFEEKKNEEK